MKTLPLALVLLASLHGCGSSDNGGGAEAVSAREAADPEDTTEATESEGTSEPAATGCPDVMPVGYVECSAADQRCPYDSGDCTCGDHDGNGTLFWQCTELSTPTIDPTTGEPE